MTKVGQIQHSPQDGNLFTDILGIVDWFKPDEAKRANSIIKMSNPDTNLDEWRAVGIAVLWATAILLAWRNGKTIFLAYMPTSGFWMALFTALIFIAVFEVLKIQLGRFAVRSLVFGWALRLRASAWTFWLALFLAGFAFWKSYTISTDAQAQFNRAEILAAKPVAKADLSQVDKLEAEAAEIRGQQKGLLSERVKSSDGKELVREKSLGLAKQNAKILEEKERQKTLALQSAQAAAQKQQSVVEETAQLTALWTGGFGNILEIFQVLLLGFVAFCERSLASLNKESGREKTPGHSRPSPDTSDVVARVMAKADAMKAANPERRMTTGDFAAEVDLALKLGDRYEQADWIGKAGK